MLDLDPRVHLDEEELAAGVDEELDRPRARVARRQREAHGGLCNGLPRGPVDRGRRGLLEDFLAAPLHRALPLVDVHGVPVGVAEDLHLDVARPCDESLEIERGIAERRLGLSSGRDDHVGQLALVIRGPDPLAAASGGRLDHHGVAEPSGRLERLVDGCDPVRSGHCRNVRLPREAARRRLVAHLSNDGGGGADERDALRLACGREGGVLGKEAVARVDRVRAGRSGGLDERRGVEVALARARRPDVHSLVGSAHVERRLVRVGIHGDGGEPELAAGADDANGDLAPVRDKHLTQQAPSVGESDDVLTSLHEILVLDEEALHHPGFLAPDLVKALHDLHQPDDVSGLDTIPFGHVRGRVRIGPPIEGAWKGGLDRRLRHAVSSSQASSRLASASRASRSRSSSVASSIVTSRKRKLSPTGRS